MDKQDTTGKDEKYRKGWFRYRRILDQTSIFLALLIVFLGVMFLTREREMSLKKQILTGLGMALNICIAAEFGLREKWMWTALFLTLAVLAALILAVDIFTIG